MTRYTLRLFLSIVATTAGLLIVSPPARAHETKDFIISYWCGPPSDGNADAQYAEVAECNFTYAMPPVTGVTPDQNKAILNACEKYGLKYILPDNRILANSPGDPKFNTDLDAVINDYGHHPALAGYYLMDEPAPDRFAQLAAANQYLLKKDPQRLPFINLYPNYVDEPRIGGTYENFVDKYCATVKPKLLCYDHYALFPGMERDIYFANLETIRRSSLKYDMMMGYILQCTPHGTYRDPSDTDLRWQVNTALAYGCKALFYFTYFTPTDPEANFHNGILDAQGKRTPHYAMAKAINGELKKLSGTLVHLTSTGVYHTGAIPKGCIALPADKLVQVKSGGPLVLGFFKHDDGSQWTIIVNRDFQQVASVTLGLDQGITSLQDLSPQTGKLTPLPVTARTASFQLPAGGIKLLKLAP